MDDQDKNTRFPRNKALHARRRLILLTLGVATYGLSILLSRAPDLAESYYGSGIGPLASRFLTIFTGWASFSIGELLLVAYLLFQVLVGYRAVGAVGKRERSLPNALGSGFLRIARDAGLLMVLFYFLWGFNYSRPPLENTLGWELPDSVSVEEVATLLEELIRAANEEYLIIHGDDDTGSPTVLPAGRDSTVEALAAGWILARESLGFPLRPEPSGRVKTPLLRPWYEWVGVAGFYFPFTGEPNVRPGIPAIDLGKILAHEMAHQRGVAREAEANFWGFLTAALSSDPVARYSAFVFAQHQLLAQLARVDRERATALAESRLSGVRRDIRASMEYWASHRGRGTRVGRAVNDAYLRSNRVQGGVLNYSRSVLLLLTYARDRGGRITP